MRFKARFQSERGVPLVTQQTHDTKPMLTVENYDKWYDLYIITVDGYVEKTEVIENELTSKARSLLFDGWSDHAFNPNHFKELAEEMNFNYDTATIESVERRWQTDHLNMD